MKRRIKFKVNETIDRTSVYEVDINVDDKFSKSDLIDSIISNDAMLISNNDVRTYAECGYIISNKEIK